MPDRPDPAAVRALTERLVALPSVSPDAAGENRVADACLAALPAAVERGAWPLADGRRVVWARVRGRSRRALVLLGHVDTVGAEEFDALGTPGGRDLAFAPAQLRARLLASEWASRSSPELARDLEEERRSPGRWLFGRGALDMKSGHAAGIAALGALATSAQAPAGDVLLVLTPDEEHESAGMLAAVPEIARRAERDRLELVGAINLDYSAEPAAYAGVIGKALVGLWVRGVPTHAGSPFAGVDAIQMAAAIVHRVARAPVLRDALERRAGPPPVTLRLRDLKDGYNVQTAAEALAEINVLSYARSLEDTLAALEREARAALDELFSAMRALSGESAAWRVEAAVLPWPELLRRAGASAAGLPTALAAGLAPRDGEDAREHSLRAIRSLANAVGPDGPLVVPYLLPPFYPPNRPRGRPWLAAITAELARAQVPVRAIYPYISDASYLAWHGPPAETLAALMPAWEARWRPPLEAMARLDLDVVNLGPWGRDAHGLGERVHAGWAFERLPGLVAGAARAALEA